MLTKPVTRATSAMCVGCIQRWLDRKTPFSRHGSGDAAEDHPQPSILHPKTEGLTANKISIIEQLAYKNKTLIIVLQETHYTTADKLVIPNLSLAESVLSKNYGLATFVHEQLEWSLVDQSPEQSKTKWLCVDVAGYKIINVYKPPHSQLTPTTIPTFPNPSLYAGSFNASVSTGVTTKHLTVTAWAPEQHPTTLSCCMTQREQPASLNDGTSTPTRTWSLRVSVRTTNCQADVF